MKRLLLASAACAAFAGQAQASLMTTASLFSPQPPSGSATVPVAIQGAPLGSAAYVGAGFTLSFNNVGTDQGIVQGTIPSNTHATPVAGVSNGSPTYLSGDFNSAQTTNPDVGKYLSTGTGTITLTFSIPQTSFALLWGSIDASNRISFNNAANDSLTGAQVQALAAGFTSNGFQGPTGSAYVAVTADTSFTTVTLTSGVVSFEASGIAGSNAPFTPVPEPTSLALLGAGLAGIGFIRRRRSK